MDQADLMMRKIKGVFAGVIMAAVISAAGIFLLALLVYAKAPDNIGRMGVNAVCIAAAFAGGMVSGRTAGARRFLWGLAAGVCYYLLLALIYGLGAGSEAQHAFFELPKILMCFGGGMLGGMCAP